MFLQSLHEGSNGGSLLANGDIDTIYRFACIKETLLVDDGVNGNGSLTRLAVADNELTLAAADRNHGIDSLQTRLQRFLYWLTVDDTRSLAVEGHLERLGEVYITLAVDSLPQRIDDASEHVVVHADGSNTMGTLHNLSFLDASRRTEQDTTYVVFLQVHHDSHRAVFKLKQFVSLSITESIDTGYTIADGQHGTYLVELLRIVDALQLLEQNL